MNIEDYHRLSSKASMLGGLSVAVLLGLGVVEIVATVWDKKWLHWASVLVLVALGLVDWWLRNVEEERSSFAESAFLDRTIKPERRAEAVELLRRDASRIRILCVGQSVRETAAYCEAIRAMFRDANWEVSAPNWSVVGNPNAAPPEGVVLLVINPRRPQVDTAARALGIAGVKFESEAVDPPPGGNDVGLVITVGQKPQF